MIGTRRTRPTSAISGGRILLLPLILLLPGAGLARAAEDPLHIYRAQSGVEIRLTGTGGLGFLDTATGQELLTGHGPQKTGWAQRAWSGDGVFTARAAAGVDGGRRGDLSRADDDEDGSFDEDPLDGRDNDGDGRIDEDFAAISDAMVVVDARDGAQHLEFYHWAYPHLTSALFVRLSGESDPAGLSDYALQLPLGSWQEAPVIHRRHNPAGREQIERRVAHVAKLDYPGVREEGRWIGVLPLGEPGAETIRAQRGRLDLLHGGDRAFVICLADSWLQLNRLLCDAVRVERGVTDPVSGLRTPWIVPPTCSVCRQADAPVFTWSRAGEDELLLRMLTNDRCAGWPDPDLFELGDLPLGSPLDLFWRPIEGQARRVRWTAMTPALLVDPVAELSDPYGAFLAAAQHGVAGELTLRFALPENAELFLDQGGIDGDPNPTLTLRGTWLDGRRLRAAAAGSYRTPDPEIHARLDPMAAGDPGLVPIRDSEAEPSRLSLAENLLKGFPNPFRETIQIRFRIPQTVGEAFEPNAEEEIPIDLDLYAPVPWEHEAPFVSVKIYRINGQELVTLHEDWQFDGETTVHWDGTDSYGRPVASGPYFCKLQMDDWSVTRRVIFLR